MATLPHQPIEISSAERSRQVSLSCARNEASIGGQDAEDFPPIPPVEDSGSLQLEPGSLRRAINQVVFAAATDDSRPVLTGVDFSIRGTELRLAAADGFRLAVHTLEVPEGAPEREAIVPARALAELARLLGEIEEPATMTLNAANTQVLFDLGHATLVAQLIQGTFPNYGQLIPTGHTTRTEIAVREFMRVSRIASIFARDGSGIVRLIATPGENGDPGRLLVTARADEVGNNEGEIDALVEGEEAKIAFNSRYLIEVFAGARRRPSRHRDELAVKPRRAPPRRRRTLRPRRHADVRPVVRKDGLPFRIEIALPL